MQSRKQVSRNSKPEANIAQPVVAAGVVNPLLSGPKRQHFLPEFYLKGFTKNDMVAVFDRELNENTGTTTSEHLHHRALLYNGGRIRA